MSEESLRKCVSDGLMYNGQPPQYHCVRCHQPWITYAEESPICHDQETPDPEYVKALKELEDE